MTEIVPEGHKLLSEVCQAVIDAAPATREQWEASIVIERENSAILKGQEAPADIDPLIVNIAAAQTTREQLKLSADEKVREGIRSGQLTPLTADGSQIKNHDWRDDFLSDYVFANGRRVLVLFTSENVSAFVAQLFKLKTIEDLGPKVRAVVEYLRKNFADTNFGPVKSLKVRITDECPALKPLDAKTLKEARDFFEIELKARSGSR
jgi:hypothetical protein